MIYITLGSYSHCGLIFTLQFSVKLKLIKCGPSLTHSAITFYYFLYVFLLVLPHESSVDFIYVNID